MKFKGIGITSGVAFGKACIIKNQIPSLSPNKILDIDFEKNKFLKELKKTKLEILEIIEKLKTTQAKKELSILETHIVLLEDESLILSILQKIENESLSAEYATYLVCHEYLNFFENSNDELLKERAIDILDIENRLIKNLLNVSKFDFSTIKKSSILVIDELSPSMIAKLDTNTVSGIVTQKGSFASHVAILARALEIPAIFGCQDILKFVKEEDEIYFDVNDQEVYINPNEKIKKEFYKKSKEAKERYRDLNLFKGKKTFSKDKKEIKLLANITDLNQAKLALEKGIDGIGLFRTEYLFMDRKKLPTWEEQFEIYTALAKLMKDKPVIIRSIDLGADKQSKLVKLKKEKNPFLGYRAIRFCLGKYMNIFIDQLYAILRASTHKNIQIMLPFITCLEELREAKKIINDIKQDLEIENISYNKDIKIGMMLETPQALIMADIFAKEVDFFSIGTNDLLQYIMAADRDNAKVAYLYSNYQPALIRALKYLVSIAKKENIDISICGEAAKDTLLLPALLAFGFDKFSLNLNEILKIRECISKISLDESLHISKDILKLSTEREIKTYLENLC